MANWEERDDWKKRDDPQLLSVMSATKHTHRRPPPKKASEVLAILAALPALCTGRRATERITYSVAAEATDTGAMAGAEEWPIGSILLALLICAVAFFIGRVSQRQHGRQAAQNAGAQSHMEMDAQHHTQEVNVTVTNPPQTASHQQVVPEPKSMPPPPPGPPPYRDSHRWLQAGMSSSSSTESMATGRASPQRPILVQYEAGAQVLPPLRLPPKAPTFKAPPMSVHRTFPHGEVQMSSGARPPRRKAPPAWLRTHRTVATQSQTTYSAVRGVAHPSFEVTRYDGATSE